MSDVIIRIKIQFLCFLFSREICLTREFVEKYKTDSQGFLVIDHLVKKVRLEAKVGAGG